MFLKTACFWDVFLILLFLLSLIIRQTDEEYKFETRLKKREKL